jgi:hypothetical protein
LNNLSGVLKHQLDTLKRDVLGDITSAVKKVARQFAASEGEPTT